MNAIAISVIVPAFNVEDKIKRCLDGLVNQTFDNYEVLVIDDGSTDETEVVCKRYADKYRKIRYIKKENGGVSSARNLGISLAKGEYLIFVDSDDYVSEELCNGMYCAAQKYSADLVVASYFTDYNQNLKKHECNSEFCANGISGMRKDFDWIYQDCFLNSPWNKIFKKSLITELFRTDMHYFEDYYFNISYLARCENVAFIKEAYYYYVEDSQASLTKNFKEQTLDWIIQIYNKQVSDLLPYLNIDAQHLFAGSLIYGLYNTIQKCVYTLGKDSFQYIVKWRDIDEISNVFRNEPLGLISKRCYSTQIRIGAYLLKYRCYYFVYALFRLKKRINPIIQLLKNKFRNK